MSLFFTTPASQRKRKRTQATHNVANGSSATGRRRKNDDGSISGSEVSDDDVASGLDEDEVNEEEYENEDPNSKRIRLAEQYLANTRKETIDEAGFDAADVDKENLRRRMGDRLKEDTAETKGRMYRLLAGDLNWKLAKSAQFRTGGKSVTSIAIAAGHIYTVSKDTELVKWALPNEGHTSRKPRKLKHTRGRADASQHHQKAILCVAASGDGKFVATGGADNRLIIWSAETLEPLRVFTGQHRDNGHRDSVMALAFRRGTNQLFSASKDRTVKLWSCDELAYVETLFGHQDEVLDVGALNKEVCVSVGGRDRTARYWRVVEESQLVFRGGGAGFKKRKDDATDSGIDLADSESDHHEGSIERIAFVDDETFVTGSDNGTLALWNIHKKKAVFTIPLVHGMTPPPTVEERSAEIDPAFQYQDTELLLHLRPQPRWITALTVIPFSDLVISGSWDGNLRVFQISSDRKRLENLGTVESTHVEGLAHGVVNDLAISDKGSRGKDGVYIAAAIGTDHRLGRWHVHDAKNRSILFEVPRKGSIDDIAIEPASDSVEIGDTT